jgi:hypothetical protein
VVYENAVHPIAFHPMRVDGLVLPGLPLATRTVGYNSTMTSGF